MWLQTGLSTNSFSYRICHFFNTHSVVSVGSKQYSASIAFTLALFSHLVNHVNIRLQAELEETESQVPPLPTDAAGERGKSLSLIRERKGTCVHL